ncbi:MAG: MFS transporter [Clostridia bacterium]
MTYRPFYFASLAWNLGHGMSWMALPLYAASQGLSNTQIGILISVPVLAQAPLNLFGGAWNDRIGGRRILLASICAMTLAAAWLIVAQGFWMLLVAQLGLVLSRAIFWPAVWAMASELPGERGAHLGRLNAMTNFGQIAGNLLCGALLVAVGFRLTFLALALSALFAFAAAFASRVGLPRQGARHSPFKAYGALLRKPILLYSILCAYLSAVPFSLALSFYPLLLSHAGYPEDVSGVLLALRSVGAIGAALIASRFVRGGLGTPWPVWCGLLMVLATGLIPATASHFAATGLWLFAAGIGSGAMTLYFQMTISEASRPEERGSALALGGVGWNISLLTTPFAMGFFADRYGLANAFYVVTGITLTVVALLALVRASFVKRPANV